MNHPVYPSFKPQTFRNGDSVQINMNGSITPATIIRMSAGGNYWVRNERGNEVLVQKNDIFPVASIRDSDEPAVDTNAGLENLWKDFTPDFLADHLSGGGKAFYSPADDPALNAPVHDAWMGDKANLEKFIDFEAVRSGKAKVSYDPPEKPKVDRFKGLSESEIRTYLQTGGTFRYFDDAVKSAKPERGHSLKEMMKDRERLATDENVSAWFQYQMLQQSKQQQQQATSRKDGSNQEQSPGTSGKAIDVVQTGLDAAGVADPTPVSDGTNMLISLARAAKEPGQAGKHLKNAFVSGVSMIPYVGDLAKGVKYGGKAAKASKASNAGQSVFETTDSAGFVVSESRGTAGDEGVFQKFIDDLFRSGGQDAKQSLPETGKKRSLFSSFKRKVFGDSGSSTEQTSQSTGGGSDDTNKVAGDGDPKNPQTVENLAKMIPASLGGNVVGAFTKITAKAYLWAEALNFLNKATIEYNRNLLKFNGELTAAYSKLDANRLAREFKQAQKQADPMSNLIDARDKFEDSMQEFRGDLQIIVTDAQTVLTKISTGVIKLIDLVSPLEEAWGIVRKLPFISKLLGSGDIKPFNGQGDVQRLEQIRKNVADAQRRGRKV